MDIHETRQALRVRQKSIYDLPLRVVYYARVSSEKDEQLNSLNNQRLYYEDFIKRNSKWVFINGYIDEGLSAITTKKRENFHKMITDGKAGRFDFIITKEITRFARNTLDSIQYTRELLTNGVAVYFQNDNINTLDEDAELRLTIMAGIAQDEVRKLSSRIKFGHSQAIKNGVVMGNSRIYGYEKQKGKLVINEAEAEMVRMIYELYATGDYSTPKIERLLYERGYRNHKGGAINRNVIRNIIPNPKYKGYYVGNKVKIVDMFSKQQKFLPEDEWVMYKDEDKVPAIIGEETWERANEIFCVRGSEIKSRRSSFKTDNLFTGKILCVEHNTPFWMKARKDRTGNDNSTWVCSHKIHNGAGSCGTVNVKENELVEILTDVIKSLSSNIDEIVEKYLLFIKNASTNTDYKKEINALEIKIELLEQKKDKLLELSIEGKLSNDEFAKRNDVYNSTIIRTTLEIETIKQKQTSQSDSVDGVYKLKKELTRYLGADAIHLTPGIINSFLDKIHVTPKDGGMELRIYLQTGRGRSGHTIKKMIESQERQMAGGSHSW